MEHRPIPRHWWDLPFTAKTLRGHCSVVMAPTTTQPGAASRPFAVSGLCLVWRKLLGQGHLRRCAWRGEDYVHVAREQLVMSLQGA